LDCCWEEDGIELHPPRVRLLAHMMGVVYVLFTDKSREIRWVMLRACTLRVSLIVAGNSAKTSVSTMIIRLVDKARA
jgi:hypothetical protein